MEMTDPKMLEFVMVKSDKTRQLTSRPFEAVFKAREDMAMQILGSNPGKILINISPAKSIAKPDREVTQMMKNYAHLINNFVQAGQRPDFYFLDNVRSLQDDMNEVARFLWDMLSKQFNSVSIGDCMSPSNEDSQVAQQLIDNTAAIFEQIFLSNVREATMHSRESTDLGKIRSYVVQLKGLPHGEMNNEGEQIWLVLFHLVKAGCMTEALEYSKKEMPDFGRILEEYVSNNGIISQETFVEIFNARTDDIFKQAMFNIVTKNGLDVDELVNSYYDYIWYKLKQVWVDDQQLSIREQEDARFHGLSLIDIRNEFQALVRAEQPHQLSTPNICIFLISGLLYGEMIELLSSDKTHDLDALHMAIFLKSMSQLPTIQYNNSTNVFQTHSNLIHVDLDQLLVNHGKTLANDHPELALMYLCLMENPDRFIDACGRLLGQTGRFELLINEELCMLK